VPAPHVQLKDLKATIKIERDTPLLGYYSSAVLFLLGQWESKCLRMFRLVTFLLHRRGQSTLSLDFGDTKVMKIINGFQRQFLKH
jgi:hypothetical protein